MSMSLVSDKFQLDQSKFSVYMKNKIGSQRLVTAKNCLKNLKSIKIIIDS